MTRVSLLLAALACFAAEPVAAGTLKVDRTIGKQPVYRTKDPRYGLLVFGPDAKDRVWLVLDGDTLYVDRNGDGNLTDPGEKVATQKKPNRDPEEYGYLFAVGDVTVGGRTHKEMRVGFVPLRTYTDLALGSRSCVKSALANDPGALAASLAIDADVPGIKGGGVGGRVVYNAGPVDLTGVLQFADTPAAAPVIHLGGPLQVTFSDELPSLRVGREADLVLSVGTPGIGPGTFAAIGYDGTVPEAAKPIVELSMPNAQPGAPPIRERLVIKDRC